VIALRSALSDCAGSIIYSRRRKLFPEVHGIAANSRRVSDRAVADLGVAGMGC
jgi:hypothetical protein